MAIKDLTKVQRIIFICNGGTCSNKLEGEDNTAALRKNLTEHNLDDNVHTVRTKCMGQCDKGPIMFIHPEGVWYGGVNSEFTREIVTEHILSDNLIKERVVFPLVQETI
jgi:(2Fe-2S) ferredoxin